MMLCSQVRELLPDYSVEILNTRETREVSAHLKICTECRRELQALDSVVELVERFGAVEPPAGLFNGVRNQIEAGTMVRDRPAWWAWIYSRPARVAAMGLSTAALAFGLLIPVGPPAIPPMPSLHPDVGSGGAITTALAQSIRQHAMSAGEGPLTDRVAWEAMAQLVTQERDDEREVELDR